MTGMTRTNLHDIESVEVTLSESRTQDCRHHDRVQIDITDEYGHRFNLTMFCKPGRGSTIADNLVISQS